MTTPSPADRIAAFDRQLEATRLDLFGIARETILSNPATARTHGTANTYRCSSGNLSGIVQGDTTDEARQQFCARHGLSPRDVVVVAR